MKKTTRGGWNAGWVFGGAMLACVALGIALGAGPVAKASAPPNQAWPGTCWEYATLVYMSGVSSKPIIVINGLQIEGLNEISLHLALSREAIDISEVLEGLGGRGWELVAFDRSRRSAADDTIQQTWIFKRPRAAK
jgi:hypothetical protein